MKKIICAVICCLFLIGCGPTLVEKKELQPLQFDKMEEYKVNIDDIPKPDKIKRIYLTENYDITEDPSEASFILLTPEEYAKVEALLDVIIAYKDVINKQEYLVNTNVKIINTLREYLALERQKAQAYRDMWVDSENAYRQEKYDHRMDNAINRGSISAISIGSVLAILLLL